MSDWSLTWALPAHGEAGKRCGEWSFFGHEAGAETHWRRGRRTCGRFSCPVCALSPGGWASREADAIAGRVLAGSAIARRRPIHVVISPPLGSDTSSLRAYTRLRTACYRVAREAGVTGGGMVFHERRMGSPRFNRGISLGCRRGPHWHILGVGWLREVEPRPVCSAWEIREGIKGYRHHTGDCNLVFREMVWEARYPHLAAGWVVKNLGVRKDLRGTAFYILSHATQGILPTPDLRGPEVDRRGPEVVTWFGSMAYNKLKVAEIPVESIVCGVCKQGIPFAEWFPLVWEGSGPPPEDEGGVCEGGKWSRQAPPEESDLIWAEKMGRRVETHPILI